ncbi:maleylpyruvate isomerase family mycothiol-dependent enzyme [Nocardioides sp. SOB77]|uniref:Maleylpyruvate isomerase family mycothiol-dependent enzyme n=1 Tax=Nocardioides oceani TaxID=3058369 RepID=A0ABT8FJF1_9ACTN|nr:maleylpyruvate isomerase family mycothiol-dependent enzyme [Nocardioides oceani]MDN4174818.1 maleylpyruvate isomerase family mycothiol-dependent enzyme [Nocardioides oceani]
MPDPEPFPDSTRDASPLADASARFVRTVDALSDDDWRAPSLLPGWSRAHLVAHVSLNAEALAGVLEGAVRGVPTAMYPSQEQRDADIEELAAATPAEQRDRLLASTTAFADALAAVPEDGWAGTFDRTPGQRPRPLVDVPAMRLREVEVHHVDLGRDVVPADWPAEFAVALVDAMVGRGPAERPLRVHATDLDRTWETAPGATTTVRGTVAELGWWLSGREPLPGAARPTSEDGVLPRIEEL